VCRGWINGFWHQCVFVACLLVQVGPTTAQAMPWLKSFKPGLKGGCEGALAHRRIWLSGSKFGGIESRVEEDQDQEEKEEEE
jgi:hypothetical protein